MNIVVNSMKFLKQLFVKKQHLDKEYNAFIAGWLEGRFFMKNYGELIGNNKESIKGQIEEDWYIYKRKEKTK